MKLSVEQFSHDVVACGLLAAADLDAVKANFNGEKSSNSTDLAKQLVSAGKLTKYQAANAVQGKAKNLIFGEYTILSAIGAGGMGQVFKAEHRRMKRMVALKVLPPAIVKSPEAVKRFQQEVQAAARLEHVNIVTAHDAGEAHGVHYLVVQYVDGRDLASLVAERGALPVAKAIDYILQAARGLAYAHGKGVIHRDIKPANLLLSNEGVIKILDMGIARLDDLPAPGKQPMTISGEVMGTADYMAPEQGDDAHRADARADIYSLGCTLHFLLTGKPPYGGSTLVQKMMAHREQLIPSLVQKRGDVPPLLDQVFARMMAKKPAERFQTMQEVVAALDSLGSVAAQGAGNTAWAAPVRALTDGTATIASAPGETAASAKTVASLLEHEVVKKTWSATAKITGALFGTIIGPILVAFILKYLDKPTAEQTAPSADPNVATSSPPLPVSSHTAAPPASKSESSLPGATGTSSAGKEQIAALQAVDVQSGRPVDVMPLIDLKRDVLHGSWTIRNGALHGAEVSPKQPSQLRLPVQPQADYDLLLSMRRPPGAANSNIGFWVAVAVDGRNQTGVLVDQAGRDGSFRFWGLDSIDGRGALPNGTAARGKPSIDSAPARIAIKVRRGEVAVTCNDTPVFDWRGSGEQLGLPRGWSDIPSEPSLLFATRTEVEIYEIKFVPGGGDWNPLFNFRDLRDTKLWTVDTKQQELVGKGSVGRGQWIFTDRDYHDFRLRLEFEIEPATNSGICFRYDSGDKELQHFQMELASGPPRPKAAPAGSLRNAPIRGENVPPLDAGTVEAGRQLE